MKTKIISLQFALFFRDVVERPDTAFSDINKNMLNIFDAIPTTLPIPPQLPNDVPVISMRSLNNEYVCNIARSRVDIIRQRTDDNKTNQELLKDFNSKVLGFAKYILGKQATIRFGLIARFFHHDDKPVDTIREKFLKIDVSNVSELSIRYNRNGESHGYRINDIVDVAAAEAVLGGVASKGIFILRDINNVPIVDKPLTTETLFNISESYARLLGDDKVEELIR